MRHSWWVLLLLLPLAVAHPTGGSVDRDTIVVTDVDQDGVAFEVLLRDINLTTGREERVPAQEGALLLLHIFNEGPGFVDPAFYVDDQRYNFGFIGPSTEPRTFTMRLWKDAEQLAINLTRSAEDAQVAFYVDSSCICNVKSFHSEGRSPLAAQLVGGPRLFPLERQENLRVAVPNPESPGLEITALDYDGQFIARSSKYEDGNFVLDLPAASGAYYVTVSSPTGNFRTLQSEHEVLRVYELDLPAQEQSAPVLSPLLLLVGLVFAARRHST